VIVGESPNHVVEELAGKAVAAQPSVGLRWASSSTRELIPLQQQGA
jgi:hypothetical protein